MHKKTKWRLLFLFNIANHIQKVITTTTTIVLSDKTSMDHDVCNNENDLNTINECGIKEEAIQICKTKLTCEVGCKSVEKSDERNGSISVGGCYHAATCVSESSYIRDMNTNDNFLPPKSPYWPPLEIAQRSFGPARPIQLQNRTAEYNWFVETVLSELPSPIRQQPPRRDDISNMIMDGEMKAKEMEEYPYALSETEKKLVKMSFAEWRNERLKGTYSCEDMANALIKRAKYLQHIQHMNHFMYWETFPQWTDVVLEQAQSYDDITSKTKNNSILAPLYCYPIPLKGTMATTKFPSSLGFAAILHDKHATSNAEIVELLQSLHAVTFGKTNIPEMAHIGATGNYHNGIAFSPWTSNYNPMVGGSSGGSAAAVASYTSALAMSEDTLGSTNVPAVRNHVFSYDPPKFRYPNEGNPSLSVRNDQIGIMARSMDDLILLDRALVQKEMEHNEAKERVDRMENHEIVIGCSHVYYNYEEDQLTPLIYKYYEKAKSVLRNSGYTLLEDVGDCQTDDPMIQVPRSDNPFSVWFNELESYVRTYLNLTHVNIWDIVLNGFYDFGTSLTSGWMFGFSTEGGCTILNQDTPQLRKDYQTSVPARRADVYNKYFDYETIPNNNHDSQSSTTKTNSKFNSNENQGQSKRIIHLIMGPAQTCDTVNWTDDILGTCDGGRGRFQGTNGGMCMFHCHPHGVRGHKDKTFTKSKFVVPIGIASVNTLATSNTNNIDVDVDLLEVPFSLHFMSRAGPDPMSKSDEWVLDEEGPKTWNMDELYIVQRITNTLAASGMMRADATMNFLSGLLDEEDDVEEK